MDGAPARQHKNRPNANEALTLADCKRSFESADATKRTTATRAVPAFFNDHPDEVLAFLRNAILDENRKVVEAACDELLKMREKSLQIAPKGHAKYYDTGKCIRCHGRGKKSER